MAITLEEVNGKLVVRGPYSEMADINPKLKSRGFRWDSYDKVWSAKASDFSERQLDTLKVLLGLADAKPVKAPSKKKEEAAQAIADEVVSSAASKFTWVGLRIEGDNLVVQGPVWVLEDSSWKKAGLSYGRSWFRPVVKLDAAKSKDILDACERAESIVANRHRHTLKEIPMGKAEWPHIGIQATLSGDKIILTGKTYEFRSSIASAGFTWNSRAWEGIFSAIHTTVLSKLIALLANADAREAKHVIVQEALPKPAVPAKGRTNQRPGECAVCHTQVDVGEGILTQYIDEDDDDKTVWQVTHADKDVCKGAQEEARIRRQKARTVSDAKANLRSLIAHPANYLEGTHVLTGKTFMLDSAGGGVLYGGGEWVVLEAGGAIWYVVNNGADGDDWGRNNVATGGAGAIGYRSEFTEEMKVLLEVATQGKWQREST